MNEITHDSSDMSEHDTPEGALQVSQESQPHGGSLKRSKFPTYANFDGRFRKLAEIRDRLPAFRDFYIERRFQTNDGEKFNAIKIVDLFNAITPPADFFPQTGMYQRWRKKWDAEHSGLVHTAEERLALREETRLLDPNANPTMSQLEDKMHTLGAELANDAMQTLRETQDREEYFDDEVVVKRKAYVLNVFAYITKAAHSKTALDIKRQGEARETAGFMLDILRRANAGKLSDDELDLLRGSVRTKQHGETVGAGAA